MSEENKQYRGFTEDGKHYYVNDKTWEIKFVPDAKVEELQNKVIELDKKAQSLLTITEVRNLTREILETALKDVNFTELQQTCNLSELQAIASDLLVFLLMVPSERELSLLVKRQEETKKS